MKSALFRVVLPLSALFLAQSALAEHNVGNGGDAVVCYKDATRSVITSIRSFDYWEGEQSYPAPGGIQLGAPSLSVKEKIDLALSRIDAFDFTRRERIQEVAYVIAQNIGRYLVTGADLPEIDDTNPRSIPSGNCFIEQFAVQWKDPVSGQRRFAISAKFYNHPSTTNDTRAGIILHEAIYRDAILTQKAEDSSGSRYYNYAISTRLLDGANLNKYVNVLEDAQLAEKGCTVQSLPMFVGDVYALKYENTYRLCLPARGNYSTVRIHAAAGSSLKVDPSLSENYRKQLTLIPSSRISILSLGKWETRRVTAASQMSFYPNLNPYSIDFRYDATPGEIKLDLKLADGTVLPCADQRMRNLTNEGKVSACPLARTTPYVLNGKRLLLKTSSMGNWTGTNEAGALESFALAEPGELRVRGTNRFYLFSDYYSIYIDENGDAYLGTFLHPIQVMAGGQMAELDEIRMDLATNMTRLWVEHTLPTVVDGKRVLGGRVNDEYDFCHARGYKTPYTYPVGLEEVFVSGVQTFYNPITRKLEERTDERVKLMTGSIKCGQYFQVSVQ